jgi:hypothetical protein
MDNHGRHHRAQRREFIIRHHPDRGGDPTTFIAGLATFDRAGPDEHSTGRPRITIVARRPMAVRVLRALLRGSRPRRPRVR